MCGRYALTRLTQSDISNWYPRIRPERFEDEDRFHGRYNIAPRTYAPVLRRTSTHNNSSSSSGAGPSHKASSSSTLILHSMRWGVVPSSISSTSTSSSQMKTINARGEHLIDGTSPLWNSLRGSKRCVVPARGYYEWLVKDSGTAAGVRIPYFVKFSTDEWDGQKGVEGGLEEKPLMLAGLWDVVTDPQTSAPLYTFCIITTSSTPALSFLHDRMPVILSSEEDIELWLSGEGWGKGLSGLVRGFEGGVECYRVPPEVGKVGTEDPSFILPVAQRKDGIEAMFSKQKAQQKPQKSQNVEQRPKQEEAITSKTEPLSPSRSSKVKASPSSQGKAKSSSAAGLSKGKGKEVFEISDDDDDDIDVASTKSKTKRSTSTPPPRLSSQSSSSKTSPPSTKRKTPSSPTTSSQTETKRKKTKPALEEASKGTAKITNFFTVSSPSK